MKSIDFNETKASENDIKCPKECEEPFRFTVSTLSEESTARKIILEEDYFDSFCYMGSVCEGVKAQSIPLVKTRKFSSREIKNSECPNSHSENICKFCKSENQKFLKFELEKNL